jgi:hypothetical protein
MSDPSSTLQDPEEMWEARHSADQPSRGRSESISEDSAEKCMLAIAVEPQS